MMCLALLASDDADAIPGTEGEQQWLQIDLYRERIVQCLITGEYTNCGPYVLEAVINYVYVEFAIRSDADKDVWFLLALEVNLAMRMGYHRDPSHFPSISPFQGEMRRRLWATVLLGDILISSQMGMPRMISDRDCDTAEPRNLNDADIDEGTTELPPSRPETEFTAALGIIARRRILMTLGTILDLTSSIKPCTYAEVLRVDAVLQEAAENIPTPLKMKPMAASVTDSAQVIMARLFISHMIYKGRVMLHGRFLYLESPSKDEVSVAHSRDACLNASLGALQIQHVLDEETRPGGQLHTMRWRVTSIMNHQFLTATMILCSLLHRGQTLSRKGEVVAALRRARLIWMRRSASSQEAKKAAGTVSMVLARADEGCTYDVGLADWGSEGPEARRNMPADPCRAANESGNDATMGFEDGQENLRERRTPYGGEPGTTAQLNTYKLTMISPGDQFFTPDLVVPFTLGNTQGHSFTLNSGSTESGEDGSVLDEWMVW